MFTSNGLNPFCFLAGVHVQQTLICSQSDHSPKGGSSIFYIVTQIQYNKSYLSICEGSIDSPQPDLTCLVSPAVLNESPAWKDR